MKNNNTICVILPDGYKVHVRRYAKQNNIKISDVVRKAIKALLGL